LPIEGKNSDLFIGHIGTLAAVVDLPISYYKKYGVMTTSSDHILA